MTAWRAFALSAGRRGVDVPGGGVAGGGFHETGITLGAFEALS